jgi:hypothetical protein
MGAALPLATWPSMQLSEAWSFAYSTTAISTMHDAAFLRVDAVANDDGSGRRRASAWLATAVADTHAEKIDTNLSDCTKAQTLPESTPDLIGNLFRAPMKRKYDDVFPAVIFILARSAAVMVTSGGGTASLGTARSSCHDRDRRFRSMPTRSSCHGWG